MAKPPWAPLTVYNEDNNVIFVGSETTADKWYQVFWDGERWKCTCKDYLKNKESCKHIKTYLESLSQTEGGRESEESGGMAVPPPSTTSTFSKWVVTIHGKETIRYQGLLAMAHEQGLVSLGARFSEINEKLAVAWAWAFFKDGRKFYESGESTPE